MTTLRLSSSGTSLTPLASSSPLLYDCHPRKVGLPVFSSLKVHQNSKHSTGLSLSRPRKSFNFKAPCGSRHGIICQAQDTEIDISSVTDASWESLVLKAEGPVVVEFFAPWCGPCRMLHPIIGELATDYSGRLECFKLNTDESPSIATRYGVRGVPTIMIFSNGEKKETVIGAVPKTIIAKSVDKFLQKK